MGALRIVFAALVLASLGGCAGLRVVGAGISVSDSGSVGASIVIGESDRRVIARYYARRPAKRMPPGLAKRGGQLPPGLARRDTLPPGLRERRLPDDLLNQLSPAPAGYLRVIVGSDIVLMNRETRVVADIYRDIVR